MRKILTVVTAMFAFTVQANAINHVNTAGFESANLGLLSPPSAFDVGVSNPHHFMNGWSIASGTSDTGGACCIPSHSPSPATQLVGRGFGSGVMPGSAESLDPQHNLTFWHPHEFGTGRSMSGLTAEAIVTDDNGEMHLKPPALNFGGSGGSSESLATTLARSAGGSGGAGGGGGGGGGGSGGSGPGTASPTPFRALATPGTDGGPADELLPQPALAAIPVPAALPLFATGLAGLGLVAYRRKRKQR